MKQEEVFMRKNYIFLIIIIIFLMAACGTGEEKHSQSAKVDDIETIYINHGSNNLHLKSAEQENVEAFYGKRKIIMDEGNEQITFGVKKKWINIGFNFKMNAKFEVTIPNDFKGEVIVKGGSGNVTSKQLSTRNLDIETVSGNISIVFADYHSDVYVATTSGDIGLILNQEKPDVKLKSKTVSGSNIITIPISLNKSQGGKKVEGISGEGSFEIGIKTISGDITIN